METQVIFLNIIIFLLNILLYFKAKKVVTFLNHGEEDSVKTSIFKTFNIILLITHLLDLIFQEYALNIINIGYTVVTIYIGAVFYEVISYFNRKKFGSKKQLNDKIKYEETYQTKINNIFIFIIIFSLVLVNILKLWGMESALEQKGFIGIILAGLLFTSAHWLPNIFKGLTLMNSNRISKGDVIILNHRIYIVFDMGLQYTRLLNVENNKRVLLENSKFSENQISNLSKKASMEGYRVSIYYNVSYPSEKLKTEEEYDKEINKFKTIFKDVFEEIEDNKEYKIMTNKGYDLYLVEAGDYALKWKFSFYYEDFPKGASTGAIRKILSSKYRLNELIQKKAHLKGISLATPDLVIETNIIKDETKE